MTAPCRRCIVCDAEQTPRLLPDLCCCPQCGYWTSAFPAGPGHVPEQSPLNEARRRRALRTLRVTNFEVVLDTLAELRPLDGASILDVGCGHGWFVEMARNRRADAVGVEPDASIAAEAAARGIPVRTGSFPECLGPAESYDFIAFNDVWEHLENLPAVMEACHRHLTAAGYLAINLPLSSGLFFQLSCLGARLGWTRPLDRLWQRGFPSPHRSYFRAKNLDMFLGRHDFQSVCRRALRTLALRGLWNRLRMDDRTSLPMSLVSLLAVAAAAPFSRIFPDVGLFVYRKRDGTDS